MNSSARAAELRLPHAVVTGGAVQEDQRRPLADAFVGDLAARSPRRSPPPEPTPGRPGPRAGRFARPSGATNDTLSSTNREEAMSVPTGSSMRSASLLGSRWPSRRSRARSPTSSLAKRRDESRPTGERSTSAAGAGSGRWSWRDEDGRSRVSISFQRPCEGRANERESRGRDGAGGGRRDGSQPRGRRLGLSAPSRLRLLSRRADGRAARGARVARRPRSPPLARRC